jgi:hypothetical protein
MNFDVTSALEYAEQGRLEDWIHAYLTGGPWANLGLSYGLKLQRRWWRGPLELPLEKLTRCLGPEPGKEYQVTQEYWDWRISGLAQSIQESGAGPRDMPPLIATYDPLCPPGQRHSIRDGNHRMGAYEFLGWKTAWAVIWYNNEDEYIQGEEELEETIRSTKNQPALSS